MSSWLLLVVAALLVALNGFFVACEFALVKVRATRLEELARSGSRAAAVSREVLRELNSYLSAAQVGVTLVSIGLGWVAEPAFRDLLAPGLRVLHWPPQLASGASFLIAFSLVTFFHVVFGEQAPKVYAIQRPERTTLFVVWPLRLFYYLLYPVIWGLNTSAEIVLKMLGIAPKAHGERAHSEEELRTLLNASARHGILKGSELNLVESVFQFAHKDANDVMTPRVDMVYLSTHWPLKRNLEIVNSHTYTRYPLCDPDADAVIGMVHVKDLVRVEREARSEAAPAINLRDLVRPVIFVPETRPLDTLLREFQVQKMHLAIVLDEYGGTAGLVTLEDVIEEIVGEIHDEFEETRPEVRPLAGGRYLVDGKTPLDDLRANYQIELPPVESDTVGGWVFDQLGRIPQRGAVVETAGFRIEVRSMDGQRVRQVMLTRLETTADQPPAPQPESLPSH